MAASNANRLTSFCVASSCNLAAAFFGSSEMTYVRERGEEGQDDVTREAAGPVGTCLLQVDDCCFGLENGEVGEGSAVVGLRLTARWSACELDFVQTDWRGRTLTARSSSSIARAVRDHPDVSLLLSGSKQRTVRTRVRDAQAVLLELESDRGTVAPDDGVERVLV